MVRQRQCIGPGDGKDGSAGRQPNQCLATTSHTREASIPMPAFPLRDERYTRSTLYPWKEERDRLDSTMETAVQLTGCIFGVAKQHPL